MVSTASRILAALVLHLLLTLCSNSEDDRAHLVTGRVDGNEEFAVGRVNGKPIRIIPTLGHVLRSSPWNPNTTNAPPLRIKDALRLAKASLARHYPKLAQTQWRISIALRRINYFEPANDDPDVVVLDRWVYIVRFLDMPPSGGSLSAAFAPDIPVAVFLDGTVLIGTPLRAEKDNRP